MIEYLYNTFTHATFNDFDYMIKILFFFQYGIFLILLLVLQITACSLAFAYKETSRNETKKFLQSTITRYYSTDENTDAVTLMWNNLMAQMSCCGVNDYKDFETSPNWISGKGNRTIPEACCILTNGTLFSPKDPSCTQYPSDSNSFYKHVKI